MNNTPTLLKPTRWSLALAAVATAACLGGTQLPTSLLDGGPISGPTGSLDAYGIDRANALVLAGSEAETLDPANWLYGGEGILGDIFSGLVRLGAGLSPIPDLAADWTISPDATVYTFHLREGVRFHDGKTFTAADVVYSWQRALSPETDSPIALAYLDDIAGAREFAAGEAQSISGLRIIDDLTVEVTLVAPRIYFLHKLTYPVAWIVDAETVDQIDTAPNGTGPFIFDRHIEDEAYILRRNSDYHLGPVALEHVVYLLIADSPLRMYENGLVDITYIEEDLVARAQDPADPLFGNVQQVSGFCTNMLVFDVTRPPFDDFQVRHAFVLAFDGERYNDVILDGRGIMASGLYPPGLPGYSGDVSQLAYDPEAAVEALNASSYRGAGGLPEIVYTTFGYGGDLFPSDGLFVQMWQETLGVTLTVEGLDFDSYYDAIYGGDHGQIVNSGWCADFPDPDTFANLFYSESVVNHGGYANPEVQSLLEQARFERDPDLRMRMYQQIERMLVEDAAALFIDHSQAYYVVTKPYLQGYVAALIGVPQNMYVSIEAGE